MTATPGTARPGPSAGPAPAAGTYTHRQILSTISGLMLGMFLAALDQTVVSTAIRTIADDLQGYDLQAWATTAFLVTSTISTPLYGKLSDIFGRRPLFLTAISVFVVGSALCALAWSMYSLAAFRAVQGLGAGGLLSLAFAIVGDIVPPRQRSTYQGYFMAVFGTSSVIGPVVGGLLAGQASIAGLDGWRWIFLVNVPIGAVALAVVVRVLDVPHERRPHRIDWPGALALAVALVPLLIVAEQGRTWGWTSSAALVCYALGAAGVAAFVLAERRCGSDALIPLALFRDRTFGVAVTASFITGMGMFGGMLLLPQYLQVVKGSSPTVAGLQMLPLVLGIMTAAATSGQLISRTGRYRAFPVIGSAVMAVGLVLFALVGADTPLWRTMLVMVLFGVGLGFTMQPVILAVQNAVDPRSMGVATSSVTFFRQMGGTLGVAVLLSVLFGALGGRVTTALEAEAGTPQFRAALAAHPEQAQQLRAAASGSVDDTSFLVGLDPVLAHPFLVGFSESTSLVFLLAAGVLVVGFLVTLLLPEVTLGTQSGAQARAQARAQSPAQTLATQAEAALPSGGVASGPDPADPADPADPVARGGADGDPTPTRR